MEEFQPEELVNILIPNKQTESLFETINLPQGRTVHGAFFVAKGNKRKRVSLLVFDPERNVVFSRKNMQQGIIVFKTTVPGEYSFVFDNSTAGQALSITFALHTGDEVTEGISWDMDIVGHREERVDPHSIISSLEKAASENDMTRVAELMK